MPLQFKPEFQILNTLWLGAEGDEEDIRLYLAHKNGSEITSKVEIPLSYVEPIAQLMSLMACNMDGVWSMASKSALDTAPLSEDLCNFPVPLDQPSPIVALGRPCPPPLKIPKAFPDGIGRINDPPFPIQPDKCFKTHAGIIIYENDLPPSA